jgi:hypothetical protein
MSRHLREICEINAQDEELKTAGFRIRAVLAWALVCAAVRVFPKGQCNTCERYLKIAGTVKHHAPKCFGGSYSGRWRA